MKPARRAFILGGAHSGFIGKFHPDFIWKGHPDFGKRSNPTLEEHIKRAVIGAFEKTGVPASAIQKGYVGNFTGELFAKQGHLGAATLRRTRKWWAPWTFPAARRVRTASTSRPMTSASRPMSS